MLTRYRFPAALAVVLAAVLAVTLAPAGAPAVAAQATPPAQQPALQPAARIEGAWTLRFAEEESSSRQLAAFLPGGVVIATNAPVFVEEEDEAVVGGRVYSSDGIGAWTSLGGGRYAFTVVFLYFDEEENNLGMLTIDGLVTVDDSGDNFRGAFNVTLTNAADEVVFTATDDEIAGTRIRARTGG